jgi:hypothetical protein
MYSVYVGLVSGGGRMGRGEGEHESSIDDRRIQKEKDQELISIA